MLELLRVFLRLGLTAFGGPAAHFALMQREAVEQRRWMSRAEFLDLVGACNLLPGPGSTQVAMALGYRRCGWPGLLIAGFCFILPASLTTLALAWAYVRYGSLTQAQGLLYGAKPVMLAVLVQAVCSLGRTAYRRWPLALAGVICFGAALAGAPPLAILLGAGLLLMLVAHRSSRTAALALVPLPIAVGGTAAIVGLTSIFLVFLKLGVVVFGSGYVLLAFLKADLVDRLHWITQSQLIDAITAGQLTPGPLFATATFIGYLLGGGIGAALATVAIFLPSFLMAGAVGAFAQRIRSSQQAGAFLDGVNAAAVALMMAVALPLGHSSLMDTWTAVMAFVSLVLLLRYKLNATWLILGGGGLGLLLHAANL